MPRWTDASLLVSVAVTRTVGYLADGAVTRVRGSDRTCTEETCVGQRYDVRYSTRCTRETEHSLV